MDTITVGIDDSDGARRALVWALDLAAQTGATVEAVHVYSHYFAWIDRDLSLEEVELSQKTAFAAAQDELERVVAAVEGTRPDAKVERVVLLGDTAPALVGHAATHDLLVVGSRGRGGLAGLVLGSVSRRCTETARCPVVVVPAPT